MAADDTGARFPVLAPYGTNFSSGPPDCPSNQGSGRRSRRGMRNGRPLSLKTRALMAVAAATVAIPGVPVLSAAAGSPAAIATHAAAGHHAPKGAGNVTKVTP